MTLFCGSCIVATAASGTSSAPLQEAAGFLIVPFEKGIAGVSDIFGNVKTIFVTNRTCFRKTKS